MHGMYSSSLTLVQVRSSAAHRHTVSFTTSLWSEMFLALEQNVGLSALKCASVSCTLVFISSTLQPPVIWIPNYSFCLFFLQLMFKAPPLSLFLSHLVFKRCLGRYLSLHRLLLILLSTGFPRGLAVISFVADLHITLLYLVMSRALSYTQGHIAQSSLSFLQPCNSTKQRTFKRPLCIFKHIYCYANNSPDHMCLHKEGHTEIQLGPW